ncbi:MAG TPA: hypothetical protein ENI76_08565 [Ignavibacteria bacterium]|nr:hypothetical protein [Ignavibacteria bacterium]
MSNHWLRGLQITKKNNNFETGMILRLIYEFWGYCQNGTTVLTTPGGMPTTPTSGPLNGFEGSTVLATGSDGVTTLDKYTFSSVTATFTSSMIGEYITIWSPASGSSEDSIYRITNIIDSNTLVLDTTSGGSPDTTTLNQHMSGRTALNYRVISLTVVETLTWAVGNYIVLTFNGTAINIGQANSQVQIKIGPISGVEIFLSPAGTWTGTAFTDSSSSINVTGSSAGWFNAGTTGNNYWCTLICDDSSIILWMSGTVASSGSGSGLHIEIPTRSYTQAQDPDPIAALIFGVDTLSTSIDNVFNYGHGFHMVSKDGITYNYSSSIRSDRGNGYDISIIQSPIGEKLTDSSRSLNQYSGDILTSPIILSLTGVAGQFQYNRCTLRRVISHANINGANSDMRIGSNGEWISYRNGIAFPWDNMRMGRKLNPGGN